MRYWPELMRNSIAKVANILQVSTAPSQINFRRFELGFKGIGSRFVYYRGKSRKSLRSLDVGSSFH